MNVALVGNLGQLGNCVEKYLSKNPLINLTCYNRSNLKDLFYDEPVFDYLINAAGAIPQKHKETREGIAQMVEANIILPNALSSLKNVKRFLNLSTDCTFSGKQQVRHIQECYNESSPQDCTTAYGRSKSLGEIKQDNWTNLKFSVVGRENNSNYSLLNWFLSQNEEVPAYWNHFFNGATSKQFAKICEQIILEDIQLPNLLHVVPPDWVTKYQLLIYFKEIYKKDIEIKGIYTDETIDRRLSTIYPEFSKKFMPNCIYSMVKELKEFYD